MGIAVAQEADDAIPLHGYRGSILGAFLVGYAIVQVPAGLLAQKLGGKTVMLWSLGLTIMCDTGTPAVAGLGPCALVVFRFGVGIGAGLLVPSVLQLMSRWIPPTETSLYMTFVVSGANIGPILAMTLSPRLFCSFGVAVGFAFWGLALLLCALAFCCLAASEPSQHSACRRCGEAQFIEQHMARASSKPVPVISLLRYTSCWGIIAGQVGFDFGWQLLLNWLPAYLMQPRIGLDLARFPMLAALPYAFGWMGAVVAGKASDELLRSKSLRVRRRTVRKASQLLGAGCGSLLLLASASAGRPALAIAAVLGALFCYQWQMAGFIVSVLDVCPANAGSFTGLANTFSMLAGALAQPLVERILTQTGSWFLALATAGFVACTGAVVFATLTDDRDVAAEASAETGRETTSWTEYSP